MNDALVILPKTQKSLAKAAAPIVVPDAIAAAGPEAVNRLIEFFTAQIRNRNTREAYGRACSQFFDWMYENGVNDCRLVQPVHVAGWVETMLREEFEVPTVKQRLAAVRVLFDWLVTGGILPRTRRQACAVPNTACTGERPLSSMAPKRLSS